MDKKQQQKNPGQQHQEKGGAQKAPQHQEKATPKDNR